MSGFLLSVPGKLNTALVNLATLLTNWPSTKAALIDVATSSRAPASTALDSTIWTPSRAAALDGVASSVALSTTIAQSAVLNAPTVLFPVPARIDMTNTPARQSGMGGFGFAQFNFVSLSGYQTVINQTGRGVIDWLGVRLSAGSGTGGQTFGCRVTIDGTVVFNSTALLGNTDVNFGAQIFGAFTSSGFAFEKVPFYSQFLVELYSSATTGTMVADARYMRTP